MPKPLYQRVLDFATKEWLKYQSPVDTLRVAQELNSRHANVMKAAERLKTEGLVELNSNVTLHQAEISPQGGDFKFTPVVCHVIFVSPEVVTEAFHQAGLARGNHPVYHERIVKGAQPYRTLYFHEEVLRKYVRDPQNYRVRDTKASVEVEYVGDDPEQYFQILAGRRRLKDKTRCVAPLLVDLRKLESAEQRYWHAYELDEVEFMEDDTEFSNYVNVVFGGAWHDFNDPLTDFTNAISNINDSLGFELLGKSSNQLIHVPAENTERAYSEACGELYKLIGNDNLQTKNMQKFMTTAFGATQADFVHTESGRNKSQRQLLEMIEDFAGIEHRLTSAIKLLGEARQILAHRVDVQGEPGQIYVDSFFEQCRRVSSAIEYFCEGVRRQLESRKAPG